MLEFTDLISHPWSILIILADLALIIATVRLVRQSRHLKRQWLWLLLAVVWPVLAIIFASPKFQRKWLWTAFSLVTPSLSFGARQSKHLFTTPIPIDLVLSGSLSIAAVIVVGWWLWGGQQTSGVSTIVSPSP